MQGIPITHLVTKIERKLESDSQPRQEFKGSVGQVKVIEKLWIDGKVIFYEEAESSESN